MPDDDSPKLNGMSNIPMLERSAMPVTMPGSAIGSSRSSDTTSRPKKRLRWTAAAASVPSTSAISVATDATRTDSQNAAQKSTRLNALPHHSKVMPGSGKVNAATSVVKA